VKVPWDGKQTLQQQAQRITELEAENARLRKALRAEHAVIIKALTNIAMMGLPDEVREAREDLACVPDLPPEVRAIIVAALAQEPKP
jgi:hypothetical protein